MTKFKKVAALLLSLVMCLSLACTAFAEESYTVTVNDAINGETYAAYQVFEVTYDDDAVTYYISESSAYYESIKSSSLFTLVAVGDKYQVVVASDDESAAAAYIAALGAKGTAVATVVASNDTAVLNVGAAGYYFVTTSLGSLVMVNTAAPAVTITEKNSTPTDTKTVQEDSTSAWGSSNTAGIGETVNYTATIKDAVNVSNVVFHDTMSTGLTFNSTSVVVKVGETVIESGYTLVTNPTDGCTFEIKFEDGTITEVVTITYSATVNSSAVIGSTGNTNKETVSYGDAQSTTGNTTTTYVYDFTLQKINASKEQLEGATFTLADSTGTYSFVILDDGTYQVASAETTGATSTITVGKATISGLDAGTYTLTETAAPNGYNKLTETITVVIDEKGNVTVNDEDATTLQVVNQAGTTLPGTGGMGTTIFYVVGVVLMAGAAVLLITKKRMSK